MSNLTISQKPIITTTNLTPIEIVLGIDDQGRTTARKLYEFLELNLAAYARWCNDKILNNEFALEGTDYEVYNNNVENPQGGRPSQDYKLTASFAKKLAMGTHNFKGEAAKNYFITVEDKLKEIIQKPTCIEDVLIQSLQEMKEMRSMVEQTKQAMKGIEGEVQGIRDVVTLSTVNWKKDIASLISKIALKIGGFEHIRNIREESYKLLEQRMGVSLSTRLTNKRRRMAEEGICKSKRDKLSNVDIIGEDKKLVEGYVAIVKDMAIKNGVA